MKLLSIFLFITLAAFAQVRPSGAPITANRIIRSVGVPPAVQCSLSTDVGKVYIRSDAAAANSSFYSCDNTASMTYAWELSSGSSGLGPCGTTVIGDLPAFTNILGTGCGDSGIPSVSGVSAGTYGDSTHVGQFTVTAFGTISSALAVGISGTGGVGTPPTFGSFTGTTQTITAATHGQGVHPIVVVTDNASPRNVVGAPITIATNGDVVIGPVASATYNWWIEGATGGFANCMTTSGDIIYGGASGICTRLGKGSDGNILWLASGLPAWIAPVSTGVVIGAGNLTNAGVTPRGPVPYVSGVGTLNQDNTVGPFVDPSNHRFGILTSLPRVGLEVGGGSPSNSPSTNTSVLLNGFYTSGSVDAIYNKFEMGNDANANFNVWMGVRRDASGNVHLVFGNRISGSDTTLINVDQSGNLTSLGLKTTGAATGKNIVCVDTSTGQLYASSAGTACLN